LATFQNALDKFQIALDKLLVLLDKLLERLYKFGVGASLGEFQIWVWGGPSRIQFNVSDHFKVQDDSVRVG